MRARVDNDILYLHQADVPHYKKSGSVVRNSYFWALRSIADRSDLSHDWEYTVVVWPALERMLMRFADSGYLSYHETILELPYNQEIPQLLQRAATWASLEDQD